MIADRVRRAWRKMNGPIEGDIDIMYCDGIGLVTTACGVLIDSPGTAQQLAWLFASGLPAGPQDVSIEWHRVKSLGMLAPPGGWVWTHYRSPTGLYLADKEMERVTLERLDADVDVLTARWPGLPNWHPAAQAATAALSWAVGPGRGLHGLESSEWPHEQAALDAQDWPAAARAGQLSWATNPGVRPRDFMVSALYLEAAGVSPDVARAFPTGSSADVARQALAAWDATAPEALG